MKRKQITLIVAFSLSVVSLIGLIACIIGMSSSPVEPDTGATKASSAWSVILSIVIPLLVISLIAAIVLLIICSSTKRKEKAKLPIIDSTIRLVAPTPLNDSKVLYKIVDDNPNTEKTFRSLIFSPTKSQFLASSLSAV